MAAEPLRITYVGGGSKFVVTFLHGPAAEADTLRALGRPLEPALVDPDRAPAAEARGAAP